MEAYCQLIVRCEVLDLGSISYITEERHAQSHSDREALVFERLTIPCLQKKTWFNTNFSPIASLTSDYTKHTPRSTLPEAFPLVAH